MPNSFDVQDQGNKSPGFPEEKPITPKKHKIQPFALSILLVLAFCVLCYLAYVQFWLVNAIKH